MASGKILNVHIALPAQNAPDLLEQLQIWGGMEFTPTSEDTPSYETSEKYLRTSFILSFLSSYAPKESLFKKLREGPPEVTHKQAQEIHASLDIDKSYEELREMDLMLKEAESKIQENQRDILFLEEYSGINLKASDLNFNLIGARAGEFAGDKSVFEESDLLKVEVALKGKYSAVFYLKDQEEEIAGLLEESGFIDIHLPEDQVVDEKIASLERTNTALLEKIKSAEDRISKEFLPDLFKYRVLADLYENQEERKKEALKSTSTEYTRIIKGWVPEVEKENLLNLLHEDFPLAYSEFSEADPEDNPPVILQNSKISRPFELVTSLYGTPAYGQVDPTPFVAPSFIFFFGLCLSDAGYGSLLVIGALLGLKFFKLGRTARNFLKIFLWAGGASIVVGALLGSWFGNAAEATFLNRLKIYDSLESPELFLYFSIVIGFLHVVLSLVISAVKNIQDKNLRDAFYGDIPWILILVFGATYALAVFAGLNVLLTLAAPFLILGLIGVLFFSGYESSSYIARFGSGLYNLYGGVDFIKDMLSYSRLFALGMATGILAMAVNEIAGFITGGLRFVLVPIVLIAGHLILNLFMSTLSAYVHTSRLQYVEFFTRFFKGGGRSFTPLAWKNRFVDFVKEPE